MKLPAIQFYPGDWRKDPGVQSLSYEEKGIWLELLFLMHESEFPGKLLLGGKPYPTDRLARLLGLSPGYLEVIITSLITLGVASQCEETGALMNRRMVRDRKLSEIRAESGKKGGNPNFQKGKSNPYYDKQKDNQKITPSSSSSTSASTTISTIVEIEQSPPVKINKARGTIEELKAFALEIGLTAADGESMFHHWEANGWKNGSSPSRDWQSGMRKWKSQGWLPSQKGNIQKTHRKNEYPQETLELPD